MMTSITMIKLNGLNFSYFLKHPEKNVEKIAKISQCVGEEGRYIANSCFFLYT